MSPSQQRKSKGPKTLFTAALVLGAFAVNFPLIRTWVPALDALWNRGAAKPRDAAVDPLASARDAATTPRPQDPAASPLGEAALWHRPVSLDETVPDPFVRQRKKEEPRTAGPSEAEAAVLLEKSLPEVSLVLVGSATRRAVVGGRLVAEGDATPAGRILAIEADGVRIQVDATREAKLPLRARTTSPASDGAKGAAPAGAPPVPAMPPRADKSISGGDK